MLKFKKRPGKKIFLLGALGAGLLLGVFGYHFGPRYFFRYYGYLFLDGVEGHIPSAEIETLKQKTRGLRAKIVWSSSRTGNHEIFLLTLPEVKTYQLTHHPHVDFFPRFSPDGEKILFVRSRKPWVSQREPDPWDIYLFSLTTRQETLLIPGGNFPQWISADTISFLRNNQVLIKNLSTGREEMVLDGKLEPVSAFIGMPEFSPRDKRFLAFEPRGKLHGVFILDRSRGTFLKFGPGCQLTWFPNGSGVLWIEGSGRGGTQILTSSPFQVDKKTFMDLPGAYSHEYFPRLSRDGNWLVWGASAGDHEPDIADYEIFLWNIHRPPSEAVRLTYSKANDRWPDIFIEPAP